MTHPRRLSLWWATTHCYRYRGCLSPRRGVVVPLDTRTYLPTAHGSRTKATATANMGNAESQKVLPDPSSDEAAANYLVGPSDLHLHMQHWWPAHTAEHRGAVVLCHGYGEHAGRYNRFATALTAAGLSLHCLDLEGSGKSQGDRGYIEDWDRLVKEEVMMVKHVAAHARVKGKVPLFLMGHSMGGGLVLVTALALPDDIAVNGVVMSSPLVEADPSLATPVNLFLVRNLTAVLPKLGVDGLDPSLISRVPAEVEAYAADPLVYHDKIAARTANEFMGSYDKVARALQHFDLPYLMVAGDADKIVSFDAAKRAHECTPSADKTFVPFEGGFHELLNDECREEATKTIVDWLLARL